MQNEILTPSLKAIGEPISHELGAKMVKDFQDQNPNETKGHFVGSEILQRLLSQPDCTGIRIYNAVNELGNKTLVLVGIGSDNKEILEYKSVDDQGCIVNIKGLVVDRVTDLPKTGRDSSSTSSWSSYL